MRPGVPDHTLQTSLLAALEAPPLLPKPHRRSIRLESPLSEEPFAVSHELFLAEVTVLPIIVAITVHPAKFRAHQEHVEAVGGIFDSHPIVSASDTSCTPSPVAAGSWHELARLRIEKRLQLRCPKSLQRRPRHGVPPPRQLQYHHSPQHPLPHGPCPHPQLRNRISHDERQHPARRHKFHQLRLQHSRGSRDVDETNLAGSFHPKTGQAARP